MQKFNSIFSNVIFIIISIFLVTTSTCIAKNIELEPNELKYIADHPILKIANEMDWPPFDFSDGDLPKGYSIDLIKLIAEKSGFSTDFINGYTWSELLTQFKNGDIDIMPAIYESEERKEFALFTQSYYSQPSMIVVRLDEENINSLTDLNNRNVAVIEGFMISSTLNKRYPDIFQVPVNNVIDGIKAVSIGDADVFIDGIGVISHVIQTTYIPNVKYLTDILPEELNNPPLHLAVGKDNEILLNILQKALSFITPDEREKLRKRWLNLPKAVETVEQTDDKSHKSFLYSLPWWYVLAIVLVILGIAVLSKLVDRPISQDELDKMNKVKRFWLFVSFRTLLGDWA